MTLHPGAQAVLDLIAEAGRPSFEEMSVPDCRDAYVNSRKALQPDPIEVAEVRNLIMPGTGGDMKLRMYRATPSGRWRAAASDRLFSWWRLGHWRS